MDKKHAILITPETHLVDDVDAYLWNDYEIYRNLLNEHEIVYRNVQKTGDTMVLDGFLNSVEAGKAFRCDGFELFGERYYGNGLILPEDETQSHPRLSPQEVSRSIRFFRVEPSLGEERQQLPSHASWA